MRALSAEGVLSLKPTLIIATTAAGPADARSTSCKATGIEVMILPDQYDYDSVVTKIAAVGKVTGKVAEAEAMIAKGRADMAELAGRQAGARPTAQPRVLFLLSMSGGAPQAAGRDTAADGIIKLAGGINAVDGYTGYRPLTPEAVIASRADFVAGDAPDRAGDGRQSRRSSTSRRSARRRPARPARSCSSTRCSCWASARARRRPRTELAVALHPDLARTP